MDAPPNTALDSMPLERIVQAIYILRGQRVMLDRDLAIL
jgi:hypothetical protein